MVLRCTNGRRAEFPLFTRWSCGTTDAFGAGHEVLKKLLTRVRYPRRLEVPENDQMFLFFCKTADGNVALSV